MKDCSFNLVLQERQLTDSFLPTCITTDFVDTRLWKTKHPLKRFPNFRQSYVLSTSLPRRRS